MDKDVIFFYKFFGVEDGSVKRHVSLQLPFANECLDFFFVIFIFKKSADKEAE